MLGLSVHDVPTSIGDDKGRTRPRIKDLATKTDFAFLASGLKDRAAIVTLTFRPSGRTNSLTGYFYNLSEERFWTNQVGTPNSDDYVIRSAQSGEYLLIHREDKKGLGVENYFLINSARFFRGNFDKTHGRLEWTEKALPIPADVSMTPAFSDDGKWYAFVKPDVSRSGLPNVEVFSTAADSTHPLHLDFSPVENDLKPKWKISGMSFAAGAKSLVVSFEAKPFLLTFAVPEHPPQHETEPISPTMIPLKGGPPRGFAHRSDGKHVAVVSKDSIFIDDLAAPEPSRTETAVSGDSLKGATCVTFGPVGVVLATGDRDGVVAVRSVSIAPESGGQIRTEPIIRLKHVGPIQKLAFSPDGRVLAALALLPDASTDVDNAGVWSWERNWDRPGLIRLWVTDGWERTGETKEQTGSDVAPDAK